MKELELQINLWDNSLTFLSEDDQFGLGDYLVVNDGINLEIGKVVGVKDFIKQEESEPAVEIEAEKKIIRKANLKDLEKLEIHEKEKEQAMDVCKTLIDKNKLPMKLVDIHFSFDDKKVVFAFISESRVDFRQLVKDLTRHFQKNIRLHQLGVRDEAKINGDIGSCGIEQCCKTHLKVLGNVSAEQAEIQQVSHRGAERLSGICNRLKCCLRYENDFYQELTAKFPPVGTKVKTPKGIGIVKGWHLLEQTVNVLLDEETIVEISLDDLK